MLEINYVPKPVPIIVDHEKVTIGILTFKRAFFDQYEK